MSTALLLLAAAGVIAVWVPPRRSTHALRVPSMVAAQVAGSPRGSMPLRLTRIVAVLACLVVVPMPGGVLAAAATWWVLPLMLERLESQADRKRTLARQRALPMVADLLAASWEAGAAPFVALDCVGRSMGGPLGEDLVAVAARTSLGAGASTAWAGLSHDAVIGPVARALIRSDESGTAPTEALRRAARQAREQRRRAGEAAARRAAVRATAPLGLCFLPAFIVLGIAPVVMAALGPLATQ